MFRYERGDLESVNGVICDITLSRGIMTSRDIVILCDTLTPQCGIISRDTGRHVVTYVTSVDTAVWHFDVTSRETLKWYHGATRSSF